MRICLLTTSTTVHQAGGTEVQAGTLAAEAARQGHTVFVLTSAHPEGTARESRDGYTTVYIPGTHFSMSRRWERRWRELSPAAAAALRSEEGIDVFWAENFAGLPYAALPRAERAPVIAIANGLAVKGEIASVFSGVSGPAGLAWFLTRYAAQLLFSYLPWYRALARDSDLIAAVSRETAAALEAELPASRGKIEVVYNPVDCALFRPDAALRAAARRELGLEPEQPAVLMSGVLHRQKGMHLGLEAFSALAGEFPAARLLIAGDGPERASLGRAALAGGLAGRVIFCGARRNAEMPGLYNAADVYLNPTLRGEGLGMVNIEAMACGVPCVSSLSGGTGSTIDDGVSGYFAARGDAAALAARLRPLLADAALRAGMGRAGREKALKVFEKSVTVGRYLAASERLLNRP